jgi:hypothetical protein
VCPESVIQVVRRHPDTVYYNGRNKSFVERFAGKQQHDIGSEDHPAPVDHRLDKSSCSGFQLLDVFQMRRQGLGELVCVATLSLR